jgi:hypothetical protein
METFKESTLKTFKQLTDEELDLTIDSALNKSKLSENELNAILDNLDRTQTQGVATESVLSENDFNTLLTQSEYYFHDAQTMFEEGIFGDFWKRFNKQAKKTICNSEEVQNFINNKGNLTIKVTLKYVVPLIVSTLGLSTINPIALAIVIGILALIAKTGFNTYCNIN